MWEQLNQAALRLEELETQLAAMQAQRDEARTWWRP